MAEPLAELLTLDRVEAWLRGMPEDTRLNAHCGSSKCPLEAYLLAQGAKHVAVGYSTIAFDGEDDISLPAWARRFTRTVDVRLPGWRHITAADCLPIIAEIRREQAHG